MTADRGVLMIAYHFPPLAGSSGIQRTLRFVQQLPSFGWKPIVLTAHPRAFERTGTDLDDQVPPGTVVSRAAAFDTARHLSLFGKYPGVLARPDRWMTWQFDGVRQGMRLIRRLRPRAIWSTYPIATAHLIASELHRRSGLPWIADFRDPMAQDGYPEDARVWRSFREIETRAAAEAALCAFTTPSTVETYRRTFPQAAGRMLLLENGFDEDSFTLAAADGAPLQPLNPGCTTLLHSGIVYPSERDPSCLFQALGRLKRDGSAPALKVRLRAAVHESFLHELARRHDIADMVQIEPPVGYGEALREMLRADALLVMQAANCNNQIPAKTYEYLRAGRPIVCLSDAAGDTWRMLQAAGVQTMAALDDADAIAALLARLPDCSASLRPAACAVAAASRLRRSEQLADCLNRVCATP